MRTLLRRVGVSSEVEGVERGGEEEERTRQSGSLHWLASHE